ncbi:MAG: aminomethyltransferase [Gammaproteobacteria bacterium]|jgi:aminomethyltransferase
MSSHTNDTTSEKSLRRTPLYDLHESMGAKFAPFAGFSMPVEYRNGLKHEHQQVRSAAGLFDVSHMGQIMLRGAHLAEQMECLVPSDIVALAPHRQRYSVLTNEQGGIMDDIMITRLPDALFVVANAAFVTQDLDHLTAGLKKQNSVELLEDQALLALQGPKAAHCLGKLSPEISQLMFLQAGYFSLHGFDCLVHRCGYTGCDGFEISLAGKDAADFASVLLSDEDIELAGLGARDSLRLEAGLCLAGSDFTVTTTPVEADLRWVVAPKYRRAPKVVAQFPGAEKILDQFEQGVVRQRIGLISRGRAPVRSGTTITRDGIEIGRVTSGSYSPTLAVPIAMGYLDQSHCEVGSQVEVEIRGRTHELQVTALPFVPHTYYRP